MKPGIMKGIGICLLGVVLLALNGSRHGRWEQLTVPAPSLAGNRLGLAPEWPVAVWLPPGSEQPVPRLPVLYWLPGYDDPRWEYTGGGFDGLRLGEALEELIASGGAPPMMVVLPESMTPAGSTFYLNSPLMGNWVEFIRRDLVQAIENRYPAIPSPAGRALAGNLTGGSGAFRIALRHPDVFGAIYALDPVFFFESSGGGTGFLASGASLACDQVHRLARTLPAADARSAMSRYLQQRLYTGSPAAGLEAYSFTAATALYPAAWLTRDTPPGPAEAGRLFQDGLGRWPEQLAACREKAARLNLMVLDYGVDDPLTWLPAGCRQMASELAAAGLPFTHRPHPGGHEDRLRERVEEYLLPAIAGCFNRNRKGK